MDIFGGKEGFMAFWRHFKPFGGFLDGFMVGKWTNEPCNGVDEVVNPFWVLTTVLHMCALFSLWYYMMCIPVFV